MKKVIIPLIVLTIIFVGFDISEFFNMRKTSKAYEQIQSEYHEVLEIQSKNNSEIVELNDSLNQLKANNINSNKEYEIWMDLNKKIEDLLN